MTDTDRLLASSSVVLAPAPAEPFGLSVVEAMAHGLAVVAAEGGAHTETVGDDGCSSRRATPAAARALVRLADDRASAAGRGRASFPSAERTRSTSTSTGLESLYGTVEAADHPAGGPRSGPRPADRS